MNILGISAGFHDAGISFISDDKILFAAHSERYSKVKHDSDLNTKILSDCISQFGMPDQIAYYERPWLKQLRNLVSGQGIDWSNITIQQVLKNCPENRMARGCAFYELYFDFHRLAPRA